MSSDRELTVGEARSQFLAANELPADGGYSARWWDCKLAGLKLYFYNFDWRKKAISHHDLHHILTGYKCNFTGEVQMAAWEFAAGRFPHICATMFCLPLVFIGAVFLPRRTFAAFLRGRNSTSLYGTRMQDGIIDMSVEALRDVSLPRTEARASFDDRRSYCVLVFQGCLLTLSPALVAVLVLWMTAR